ncbi:uncharacterized protein LOC111047582 [Nilaparvata lugens]|uniref:uncharacterized protein LOC111047582 n=1 Tax=Nilaparvata lugens TaxID=108931 RepID=UPI00193E7B32|nr:uncharacterized protein LOC111047582 [Nilaparvata lugens]
MMDMLDSEMIISEVQRYPCVYDYDDPDYRNQKLRRNAWMSIAMNVVGEQWDDMDKETKESIAKDVQKRWKSMKDSYQKSLKEESKNADGNAKKKRYVHHKQLSFLLPVFNQRKAENTSGLDEDHSESMLEGEMIVLDNNLEPAVTVENSRLSRKRKHDQLENGRTKDSYIPVQSAPRLENADPDEMFLLSQLPAVKRLNQNDKMHFQIKFLQLLQSYSKH